jgi:hypothetical protein
MFIEFKLKVFVNRVLRRLSGPMKKDENIFYCSTGDRGGVGHLNCLDNVQSSTSHNAIGLHSVFIGIALPFYIRSSIHLTALVSD